MANVKITGLTAGGAVSGTDLRENVQGGASFKTTAAQDATYVRSTVSGTAPVVFNPTSGAVSLTASLTSLGGLSTAADRLPYLTGTDTWALATLTAFGRSVVEAVDAAATRTVLGLGSLAVLSSVNNSNWSGAALAVANGGTGSTTSAAARTALNVDASSLDLTAATVLRDDFMVGSTESGEMGELGWGFENGTWTMVNPDANHPGTCRLATTAVSGTVTSVFLGGGGGVPVIRFDQFDEMTWIIKPVTTAAGFDIRIGLANDISSNPPVHGAYIEKLSTDTNWFGVGRLSGSQTRSDLGVAAGADTWAKLKIRQVSATVLGFSVDGGSEVQVTSNVPLATIVLAIGLQVTPTTVSARNIDVDAFSMRLAAATR